MGGSGGTSIRLYSPEKPGSSVPLGESTRIVFAISSRARVVVGAFLPVEGAPRHFPAIS